LGVPLDPEIKPLPVGEAELLRDGDDVVLVAIGNLVSIASQAAQELKEHGISAAVLNARFVKPLDIERIRSLALQCGAVVTLEEHALMGGFGAAVLEGLAEQGVVVPVRHLGIPDELVEHGASLASLGLDVPGVVKSVETFVADREVR
jgi:1-deoxy-D-xylulose-5-phosphate synthase